MYKITKREASPSACRVGDVRLSAAAVPTVSVVCIVHNHAAFLPTCLDGFLMQETTFPVEIIVHDDASTDGTTEIVLDYQRRYPSVVRPIVQEENQYSKGNKVFGLAWRHARGKYVAMCDGDDYWTDPKKLQTQIEFLESHPTFSICFHKVEVLQDNRLIEDYITHPRAGATSIIDLAEGNYVHTCSCVFRNRGVASLGKNYRNTTNGDYYIHFINAQYGDIFCLDKVMAVYRVHGGSIWSQKSRLHRLQNTQATRRAILEDLEQDDSPAFRALARRYLEVECTLLGSSPTVRDSKLIAFPSRTGYARAVLIYLCELQEQVKSSQDKLSKANSIRFCVKRALTLLKEKVCRVVHPT